MHTQKTNEPYNSYSITLLAHNYATFSFSSIMWLCSTGPYAIFSSSSILWLCTSSVPSGRCSCVFDAGLELRLFLFHLLTQTVSKAPHTVPDEHHQWANNSRNGYGSSCRQTCLCSGRSDRGHKNRVNQCLYIAKWVDCHSYSLHC